MKAETKMELMSPAGSYEAMMAAIHAGADSIYFGVEQLNMRTKSSNNFTFEDLEHFGDFKLAIEIGNRCFEWVAF